MKFSFFLIAFAIILSLTPVYAQDTSDSDKQDIGWDSEPTTSVAEADATAPPAPPPDTVTIMTDDDRVTIISSEEEGAHTCVPPCRAGYTCIDGECVSLCNPPCPEGTRCDPKTADCVPLYTTPYVQQQVECTGNKLLVNGECLKKKDIYTKGDVIFTITDIFFGMGTVYSAIVPFIVQERCWHYYDWDPYDSSYYYYWEDDAILSTAPQTGMFVFAGAFNQISKAMQRDMLEDLGEKPSYGLYIASWGLWHASIGTATASIFSNLTEDRSKMKGFSILNCIVLFSSYFVSNATFFVQQSKLKKAVKEREAGAPQKQAGVKVYPYYSYLNKTSELGLAVQF